MRLCKILSRNKRDEHHPYFRFCIKCNKKFDPKGWKTKVCEKCIKRIYKERAKKKKQTLIMRKNGS